ncbi:hypothetical protein DFP72DRAFT_1167541 [Ephemerocybe angulata]|uniref:Uncharacterized protein n=1 Tax=Ephemerocybe angulata TaxID=980116 RepID=A0A8H6MB66_9AGAR|nr:hypothetical protein DFP72DRAFT_1167541 [Tulosesus angulatus]
MSPPGWANPFQKDFLQSLIPEYEQCKAARNYKDFWPRLFDLYLKKFPLLEELYPGAQLSELNEEQFENYKARLAKLQQRLKEWYRWQMNPRRSRNMSSTITPKAIRHLYNSQSRNPKVYEAFAKLYPELTHDANGAACSAEGLRGRRKLAKWYSTCKKLLSEATPEQLSAVEALLSAKKEEKEEEEKGNASFQKSYDLLPGVFEAVLEPAVRKAGVMAFVTIVGPVPAHGGKILANAFQYGGKEDTPLFSKAWADYEAVDVETFAKFVRRHEFSPEVCENRSLTSQGPPEESLVPSRLDMRTLAIEALQDLD